MSKVNHPLVFVLMFVALFCIWGFVEIGKDMYPEYEQDKADAIGMLGILAIGIVLALVTFFLIIIHMFIFLEEFRKEQSPPAKSTLHKEENAQN